MAIIDFQKAMYNMIANPTFCIQVRQKDFSQLSQYNLTPKEQNRLVTVANQKGMNTNCTLYRINRVTPIYTMMPYTCKLLGDQLLTHLSGFWEIHNKTNLQFKDEVRLFHLFLQNKLFNKEIEEVYLKEILELEGKMNELRFNEDYNNNETDNQSSYKLSSLVRIVPFLHNPKQLFDFLTNEDPNQTIPVEKGEYYLLIENNNDELLMKVITNDLGNILLNIDKYDEIPSIFFDLGLVKKV